MARVRRTDRKEAGPSVGAAVDAFLSSLGNAGTARNYAGTLRALVTQLGVDTPLAALASPLAGAEVCSWFEARWGERGAATWNRNLDAVRSASSYWADQGWLEADPAQGLRRRKRPPDRTRAISRAEVEALLSRGDVALRDKTLWRMLYETAARISRGPFPRRPGPQPAHSPSEGAAQGRGGRRHRVADRYRPALAAPLAGQENGAGVPDRAPRPGRPARDRPRPGERPGPSLVPSSRRGLRGSDGGLGPAPAPALGPHSRRRGRSQHLHAACLLRPHLGQLPGPLHPRLRRGPYTLAGKAGPWSSATLTTTVEEASASPAGNLVELSLGG